MSTGPVASHTEWQRLEEVIVGSVEGAAVPRVDPLIRATLPELFETTFGGRSGQQFPADLATAAQHELDAFAGLLEREGVTVRRPDPVDHTQPYATVDWECPAGLYSACPRDSVLVVGDRIIEAPMAYRSRYFETFALRSLFMEYFRGGAHWISAPKPRLTERSFAGDGPWCTSDHEPLFDAADFVRFGRDLVVQRSQVTNQPGIDWMARTLGPTYSIHVIEPDDPNAMHLDATVVPLAPGKVLLNPVKLPEVPTLFRDWEHRYAPPPARPHADPLYFSSAWLSMNLLSLDESTVLVESSESDLIELLRCWGFDVLTCPFRSFNAYGGSFHCATLDVRRDGPLESYL
jgi:glycine amidinotransferase